MTHAQDTERQQIQAEVAATVHALPALPAMCHRILLALNDPNADLEALARQAAYDPGLTANVLRMANSAYFGAGREIGSLREAFVRIGTRRLFELTMGTSIGPLMREALPGYALRPHELLRHSVWTAVAAERLAVELHLHAPDLLFTAGLLHDMGKIILDPFVQTHRARLDSAVNRLQADFEAAERDVLGMDHAQAGAAVLRQWRLPPPLVEAVAYHHDPEHAPAEHLLTTNIVHVANILADASGVGSGIAEMRHAVSAQALATLQVKTAVVERVSAATLEAMEELEQLLG
jgi:putative nucleotidyltransferase with HDIG domain